MSVATITPRQLAATIVVAASDSKETWRASWDNTLGRYLQCDGTNDEVEIQAALNALPVAGGTIILLEGTYYIDGTITINRSYVNIIGCGMQITTLLSRISGAVTGRVFTTSGTPDFVYLSDLSVNCNTNISQLNLPNIDTLIVERIRLYNGDNTSASCGFSASNITNAVIRDCQFSEIDSVAVGGSATSEKITVDNCIINNTGRSAIIISLSSATGMITIANNKITNAAQVSAASAIDVGRSLRARIINNVIDTCGDNGIYAEMTVSGAPDDLIIMGNTVRQPGAAISACIKVYGSGTTVQRLIIADNTCYNTVGIGIWVQLATNFAIIGNTIQTNHKGIKVDTVTEGSILGNTITALGANGGLYIDPNSTDIVCVGNEIDGAGLIASGIVENATGCNNNLISENRIKSVTGTPVVIVGANTIAYRQHSDLFMDVLAVSANHVVIAQTLAADPTVCAIAAQPDCPRTLSYTITHPTLTAFTLTFVGVNAKGRTVTEVFTQATGWTGETSNAFATVTSITMSAMTGNTVADTIDVGITDVLGLSNEIYATTDVYKIKKNNANAVVAGAQVNTTYDTYDMAVIGLAGGDDFTIYFRSNLNVVA